MPKLESTRYTVLFATAVSVVCALLVATAAVGLRERQEVNAQLYKQKNVLLAAGLIKPGESVSRDEVLAIFDKRIRVRGVDLQTGRLVPEGEFDAAGLRPAQGAQRSGAVARRAAERRAGGPAAVARPGLSGPGRRRQGRATGAADRRHGHVGHGLRLPVDRPRRQHRARPDLLRAEGNPRPGRRDLQPAMAGAVGRAQGLRRQLVAAAGRDQGAGRPARQGAAPCRRPVRRHHHQQRHHARGALLAGRRRLRPLPEDPSQRSTPHERHGHAVRQEREDRAVQPGHQRQPDRRAGAGHLLGAGRDHANGQGAWSWASA